jgi:conjugative transposon TraM protein
MNKNNSMSLKPKQKQELKKYAVFALMFMVFGGSLWLIFKPSGDEGENKGAVGLNTELPMPKESNLIRDKISAFEQDKLFQQKPVRSLNQFSTMIGAEEPAKLDLSLSDNKEQKQTPGQKYSGSEQPKRAIQSSAAAYKGINQTLGNFYEKPKEDPENERLRKELEALKTQLDEQSGTSSVDEQLRLMEKSYQLAYKYMPDATKQVSTETPKPATKTANEKKNHSIPSQAVKAISNNTTSALEQTITDSAFIKQVSQARNNSFITAGDKTVQKARNTIWACVNSNQKLVNGQNVKLRLLEPVETGGILFLKNSLITGIAQIQGERLNISIHSLEQNGTIVSVQLTAYDTDGQLGLFIPGSVEANALKEITASMGRDAGTSINISQGTSAGEQIAADVGRSFIQGTSQYVSKKLRTTKVTLKAGHKLLLMPNN